MLVECSGGVLEEVFSEEFFFVDISKDIKVVWKVDKYRVKVFYVDSILESNLLIFVLKEFGYMNKKCKDRDYVKLMVKVMVKFLEVKVVF